MFGMDEKGLGDEEKEMGREMGGREFVKEEAGLAEGGLGGTIGAKEARAKDGEGEARGAAEGVRGGRGGRKRRFKGVERVCQRVRRAVFGWREFGIVTLFAEMEGGAGGAGEANAPEGIGTTAHTLKMLVERLFVMFVRQCIII